MPKGNWKEAQKSKISGQQEINADGSVVGVVGPTGEPLTLSGQLADLGMSQTDAQLVQSIGGSVVPLPPSVLIASSLNRAEARGVTFGGWGQKYYVPSPDFSFTHLRLPQIKQTAANIDQRWQYIVFEVRHTDINGSVVATGSYKVPLYKSTLDNVVVELNTTVTAALVGGVTYWAAYYATNNVGALVPVGEATVTAAGGIMSNNVTDSTYYRLTTTGVWVKTTPKPPVYYALTIEPMASIGVSYIPQQLGLSSPSLVLPPLYGVVGREANLYFTGLGEFVSRNIAWDATCSVGNQESARWTLVPASAGVTAITVDVVNPWTNDTLATASSTITVCAANAAGSATLLCIGDSTTANGIMTGELVVLDTADANLALSLIGTQGSGANKHEGRSGWKATHFTTTGSPLYNAGVVDFANYLSANSLSTPTHVVINLGINDIFNAADDSAATTAVALCADSISLIVHSIQSAVPAAKIGVALPIPPSVSQDAFGDDYQSGRTTLRYAENWKMLIKKLAGYFAGNTASLVYLLPFSVSLDTENNMPTTTSAVNSRNATIIKRQTNSLHPDTSGYYQLADVVYAWVKNTLS